MSKFISNRRVAWLGLGAIVSVLLAACDLGSVAIPRTTSTLVVHAVLNPNFGVQTVLLERTLTGVITVPDSGFSPENPIASAGGVPESGAGVTITDSAGRTFFSAEDGAGTGVYRVLLNGNQILPGARYELQVHTKAGEDLSAFTRVPNATVRSTGALTETFNRDHDTMFAQWSAVPTARTYYVRIESPFGPFYFFTDSTRFSTTGDLRNIFSSSLEHVFIPGFHQDIVISAVDSNFYDYYRTNNDPFTGAGIISRVTGGTGLFGSLVELSTGTISTIADQTDSVEGRFRLLSSSPQTTNSYASQFTLYIESPPARDGFPAALSGRYITPNPTSRADGIVGQQIGPTVTLALLGNQLAGDTLEVFTGQLRGDTLVGVYAKTGGSAVFVRAP